MEKQNFEIPDDLFRVLCPNVFTHKVVSAHVGETVDSDSLEAVDFDSDRIAGVIKRLV